MNIRPTPPATEVISYRLKDAARAVGVSSRHLQDFVKSGELPAARIGAAVVILREDLVAFLKARRTPTPGGAQ